MSLKLILFLGVFAVCTVGSLWVPLLGVLGYVAHYNIGPERQWWGEAVSRWGLRCAYTLALFTGIGMVVNWRSLRRKGAAWFGLAEAPLEKLLLLFLGLIWLSLLTGEATNREMVYIVNDHPTVKMTKVVVFVLMLTHVVTDLKSLNWLLWTLVAGAFILGLQAYTAPASAFGANRLEGIGGSDFADSNGLAGYIASLLPIIGVQFLRSRWPGRLLCLASGVFATNAIVLTRSRGPLIGLAMGAVVAVLLSPRQHRWKITLGLLVALAGGYRLTDTGYRNRMSTITEGEGGRDAASQNRLDIWAAGVRMVRDRPLGVGAGNFQQTIGRYAPEHQGLDAHNTYVRCAGELGVQGFLVFALIVACSVHSILKIVRRTATLKSRNRDAITYAVFGTFISLITMLGCGLTATLVYFEAMWWVLALPVCLARALEKELADARDLPAPSPHPEAAAKGAPLASPSDQAPAGG